MKIVHLIWQFKLGGAEAMLVDIVNEQSLSAEVSLIVGNAVIEKTLVEKVSQRVDLRLLGRPPGSRNPWYLWKLYRMLKKIKPDIIHAHLDSFIRLLKYAGPPCVLTVHNTGIDLMPQVDRYDAVYCISDAVSNDLENRYSRIRTRIIQNGINFTEVEKKSVYGHKPFRMVQVSRLDHLQKGQDILLYAVKKVNDLLKEDAVTVDFIGEGPSRNHLLKLNQELELQKCCRFLGMRPRDYIYRNLHTYDLLVQPSRFEGFGLTVVEGMAAGLPVLVSDIEGPMEVIGHGRFGYFFHSEDVDDCARQILNIIHHSARPEFVSDRDTAERHAKATYDVAITAKEYLQDYSRVIGSRMSQSVMA